MLGWLHPDHLLNALTDEEWRGWLWYMEREPFGFPERDLRHGTLLAAILAPHMPKGTKVNPRRFMFQPPEERELTPEETAAVFRALLGDGVRES